MTEIRDIGESINIDPRGYYYVFGDPGATEALQILFANLGLRATRVPLPDLRIIFRLFFRQALQWLFLIICAATISIVGLSAIFNSKFYGIQRLQGRSFSRVILGDFVQSVIFFFQAMLFASLATMTCLYIYNGLNQIVTFLSLAVVFIVVLATLSFTAHIAAVALTFRISITGAIKGEIAAAWVMLSAYAVRISAVFITFVVAVDALAVWQRLDSQEISQSQWRSAGGAVHILLNGALEEESDQQMTAVGRWVHQEDNEGRVILVVRRKLREFMHNAPAADVLVVNDTYLAKQDVLLESGETVDRKDEKSRVRVLIPPTYERNREKIIASVSEWISFVTDLSETPKREVIGLTMRAGQSLFTYGSGSASIQNPSLDDPIVIAIPSRSNMLPDKEYANYATMASVVFLDPDDVHKARTDKKMAAYINGVQPIAQRAAYEYQNDTRELAFQIGNLGIAATVILITILSACLAYCRKNAQRIFARAIHGWPLFSTYSRLLAFEVVLAISAVAWVAQDTAFRLRVRENGTPSSMPPSVVEALTSVTGWEPVTVAVIAAAGIWLVLIVLAILNKRLIKEISVDA